MDFRIGVNFCVLLENLSSKKRHSEAARVLLDYSKDVRQAVIALVQGNEFSEARRIVSCHYIVSAAYCSHRNTKITLHSVPDFVMDIIYPGALESCAQLVEDIHEMTEQLCKQVQRLRELRVRKVEEPGKYLK